MCLKIIGTSNFYYLNSKLLTMPYYAVAVGRTVGIYENYDDCKKQVTQYPNAKYKKFNSVKDAEEFIKDCGKSFKVYNGSGMEIDVPSVSLQQVTPNEISLAEIFDKLSRFEERFDKFVSSTSSVLEDFKNRLCNIENSCLGSRELPSRRAKRIKLAEPVVNENESLLPSSSSLLIKNSNDVVVVYTDGACVNNGATGARAGIGIWFNHGHPLNVSAPLRGPATNNNAEIQAARVAINQAAKMNIKKLCINTDSKFLISCITEWIHKWKKNNWKLVNGDDVKNKVELEKLDLALQQLESVEWIHVKGHRGIEGNEMADKLARDGASRYKTNITYSDYSDI